MATKRTPRRGDDRTLSGHTSQGWRQTPVIAVLLASTALGFAALTSHPTATPEADVENRPIQLAQDGFVSSRTCRACHPSQHDSWFGSFHRTMTQVATAGTVRADFDAVVIDAVPGQPMRLERRGAEFWAEFDDPGWEGPGVESERPRITRQVVMITGSHHQQIYWYATGHDRALNVLPGVFLLDDQRWVARSAVVLHSPNQTVATLDGHWNAICVACHTTLPKTKFATPFRSEPIDQQAVDTTTAEFGISCEACHGPGAEHVRVNQNPVRRYQQHMTDRDDPTIVQPALLDPTIEPDASLMRRYSFSDTGFLRLVATPWADVVVDGRAIGQTPLARIAVPEGTHSILFIHPELGQSERDVTVVPGQTTLVKVELQ